MSSSKILLGSVALLTGAVIYEKNKHPAAVNRKDELESWKYAKNNNAYPGSRQASNSEKLEQFGKNVDAQQYDGRHNLLAHDKRDDYDLNYSKAGGNIENIKKGFKEDGESLKNAVFHNHQNPVVSDYGRNNRTTASNIKNGFREDAESLKNAVFQRSDDFQAAGKNVKNNISSKYDSVKSDLSSKADEFGNRSLLEKQLQSAEDEVNSLKKQLRSLGGRGDFTYDEQKAIDSNKSLLSGFGENASFFANEQYESVHGSPKDRFRTNNLPALFDKDGKRLSNEEILRIQRDGLRGWGENAGWFAEEQYRNSKEDVENLKKKAAEKGASLKEDLNSAKEQTKDKADELVSWGSNKVDAAGDKISDINQNAKDSISDAKHDFKEAKDDWKKWGTAKVNESEDKLKDIHENARENTKSWWNWSKDQTDEHLTNAKNKSLDVADDVLENSSKGFSKASDTLEEQRDLLNKKKN